jgi:hypothetical protein
MLEYSFVAASIHCLLLTSFPYRCPRKSSGVQLRLVSLSPDFRVGEASRRVWVKTRRLFFKYCDGGKRPNISQKRDILVLAFFPGIWAETSRGSGISDSPRLADSSDESELCCNRAIGNKCGPGTFFLVYILPGTGPVVPGGTESRKYRSEPVDVRIF